jgi:A/G-specific adenine glycosylase
LVPRKRAGDFNSAMMELGATICTPRSPQCLICPVQRYCQAFAAGKQDQIPPPRKRNPLPIHQRCTFCLRRGPASRAIWLIEQRSSRGRWAGMWQFVTVEANGSPITPETSPDVTLRCSPPRHIASIEHTLTHRRYRFDVYLCHVSGPARVRESKPPRRWVGLDDLQHYPLPKPHLQIAQLLRKTTG